MPGQVVFHDAAADRPAALYDRSRSTTQAMVGGNTSSSGWIRARPGNLDTLRPVITRIWADLIDLWLAVHARRGPPHSPGAPSPATCRRWR